MGKIINKKYIGDIPCVKCKKLLSLFEYNRKGHYKKGKLKIFHKVIKTTPSKKELFYTKEV